MQYSPPPSISFSTVFPPIPLPITIFTTIKKIWSIKVMIIHDTKLNYLYFSPSSCLCCDCLSSSYYLPVSPCLWPYHLCLSCLYCHSFGCCCDCLYLYQSCYYLSVDFLYHDYLIGSTPYWNIIYRGEVNPFIISISYYLTLPFVEATTSFPISTVADDEKLLNLLWPVCESTEGPSVSSVTIGSLLLLPFTSVSSIPSEGNGSNFKQFSGDRYSIDAIGSNQ